MRVKEGLLFYLVLLTIFAGLYWLFVFMMEDVIEEFLDESRQEFLDRGCHVVSTELHPIYGPIETWVCPDESETP